MQGQSAEPKTVSRAFISSHEAIISSLEVRNQDFVLNKTQKAAGKLGISILRLGSPIASS